MKHPFTFIQSNCANPGRHRHLYQYAILGLTFALGMCMPKATFAQFTLNCPPNTVVSTDSTSCDANVTYQLPFITGGPVTDTTYTYTGSSQIYVVPANISQITIEAWGAQGNSNGLGISGGQGGYASGNLAVTPGETLYVYVGGGDSTSSAGGWNGGGAAGASPCAAALGGGGGGGSDVRQGGVATSNRVIVAGGGGGAGGNRVQGCGRGTGGGGGGGYYGGGGGAGWPFASTVLPTGGTQTAGGIAGTSTYTSAPNNNGSAGALLQGGNGGNEVSSTQGGDAPGLPGGAGGDTIGGIGQYVQNWTGQSGGGGSGYVGGVTNDSMATGTHTGSGQVRITANLPFTLTQTAGIASGSTFPIGSTTNAFTVVQNSSSDSCSFVLTVTDQVAPNQNCPGMDTLFLDANCEATMPDYTTLLNIVDNCDPNPTATQSPAAGTAISGANVLSMAATIAMDSSGNVDTCSFSILLVDTIAPIVTTCPQGQIFNPQGFNCNPTVNFTPAVFTENCAASITASHNPGDPFPIGTTVVTYTATDSSGNNAVCSFTLTVNTPTVSNLISVTPLAPCPGDTFSLQAAPGYTSYAWSNGATTPTTSSSTAGWFWVDITDSTNCTVRDSFEVVTGVPMPMIMPNGPALCTGNYATYQWFLNGQAIPGATSQCHFPTANGSFQVVVTDSGNCQGISDTLLFVNVDDGFRDPGFEVYPNPVANLLHLRMNQPLNAPGKILVYDLTGRIVKSTPFDQLSGVIELELGSLADGSYIVEISAPEFRGRRRIIHTD